MRLTFSLNGRIPLYASEVKAFRNSLRRTFGTEWDNSLLPTAHVHVRFDETSANSLVDMVIHIVSPMHFTNKQEFFM